MFHAIMTYLRLHYWVPVIIKQLIMLSILSRHPGTFLKICGNVSDRA